MRERRPRNDPRAEKASNDTDDSHGQLHEEEQDKACCKAAHDWIQTWHAQERIRCVVRQADKLKRHGGHRTEQEDLGIAEVGVVRHGDQALPRRPEPPANGEHDKEHEAVANLVEVVVDDARLGRGTWGAAISSNGNAAGIGKVCDAEDDFLRPASWW